MPVDRPAWARKYKGQWQLAQLIKQDGMDDEFAGNPFWVIAARPEVMYARVINKDIDKLESAPRYKTNLWHPSTSNLGVAYAADIIELLPEFTTDPAFWTIDEWLAGRGLLR